MQRIKSFFKKIVQRPKERSKDKSFLKRSKDESLTLDEQIINSIIQDISNAINTAESEKDIIEIANIFHNIINNSSKERREYIWKKFPEYFTITDVNVWNKFKEILIELQMEYLISMNLLDTDKIISVQKLLRFVICVSPFINGYPDNFKLNLYQREFQKYLENIV